MDDSPGVVMRVFKACTVFLFLFTAVPGLAAEKSSLNLDDRISDEEVNRTKHPQAGKKETGKYLFFGFDLRSGPMEDARQYLPFLNYLKKSTGYDFKLRFTPKNSSIIDDLGMGKIHFAAIGAVSFIQAREMYGVVGLVRGINSLGKAEYRSTIVVLPNSDIEEIEDLKGKRFAFGSVSSTQGHLIPRIVLSGRSIGLDDLASYKYTGSHQNCVNAVIKGSVDACGMQDTMAERMVADGLVRILHRSGYYPSSGIAANQEVAPNVVEKVTQALLDFDPLGRDKEGLHNWNDTEMPNGFTAATGADYVELRDWLIRLGDLKENNQPRIWKMNK